MVVLTVANKMSSHYTIFDGLLDVLFSPENVPENNPGSSKIKDQL